MVKSLGNPWKTHNCCIRPFIWFFLIRFKAIWDDRDSEYGEVRKYEVLYILATDNVVVKEVHDKNDGRDPYPLLLRKTKLPKVKAFYNKGDLTTIAYATSFR